MRRGDEKLMSYMKKAFMWQSNHQLGLYFENIGYLEVFLNKGNSAVRL